MAILQALLRMTTWIHQGKGSWTMSGPLFLEAKHNMCVRARIFCVRVGVNYFYIKCLFLSVGRGSFSESHMYSFFLECGDKSYL